MVRGPSSEASSTLFVGDSPLTTDAGSQNNLEKIDELFARGVGQYVALPQIVVVGDQSSGKSSVLEGLTDLPFPRDSGLCTRFATQIIFRRDKETKVSVSVLPAKNAGSKHQRRVKNWSKHDLRNLSAEDFANIINEVHTVMGLTKGKPVFSADVLKLEVKGPDQQHFSVVDLPGMFRKTTEGETTQEDRDMVRQMIESYMENPRSIMLAVVPANVDVATQEILEMAKRVDSDGSRTIGVLTKPDLVDIGAEASILELIKGKKHKLALGWCVVRNPGKKHLSSDRDALEKEFFDGKTPWDKLSKAKVGIRALKKRLQETLTGKIRRAFPEVKMEIQKQLMAAKEAIDELGPRRETTTEQLQFAVQLSTRYQEIVNAAIQSKYKGCELFHDLDLRFATQVVNRNRKFNSDMANYGHTYEFQSETELKFAAVRSQQASGSSSHFDEYTKESIELRTCADHPDLTEMSFKQDTIIKNSKKSGLGWLSIVYDENRGFHLGTFNSELLAITIEIQTRKWEHISKGYIVDVVNMAHTFITKALRRISPTQKVFDGLMEALMDSLKFKYQQAIDKVSYLLMIERLCQPTTMNQFFSEALEKSRQSRHQAMMDRKAIPDTRYGRVIKIEDALINSSMSNDEYDVQTIHDVLRAYYEVARKRFVDNICMQACDDLFVSSKDSPLRLFSQEFASGLNTYMLEGIAGEDSATKSTRRDLQHEISDLEEGKKILM